MVVREPGPVEAEVEVEALTLVGAPVASGLVGVRAVRDGFAELDFAQGPCLLALDFLPPCREGDVLRLRRRGGQMRIRVDRGATARAEKKLLRLWSLLAA